MQCGACLRKLRQGITARSTDTQHSQLIIVAPLPSQRVKVVINQP